ncbi:NUDIX hydrolase [Evansella vedderi]|nr:8-oxo-dGTP diphosphatase [Evansella vedderi]
MQRVTHCILTNDDKVLMLKKPSRGWWVAPGGKMEQGESIRESVTREYFEETGITLENPKLRGIFTIIIEEKGNVVDEWMMFTFQGDKFNGQTLKESPEGALAWQPLDSINDLPMAPGDYLIFDHVLSNGDTEIMYGTFKYTENFKLLAYRLDVDGKSLKEFNRQYHS